MSSSSTPSTAASGTSSCHMYEIPSSGVHTMMAARAVRETVLHETDAVISTIRNEHDAIASMVDDVRSDVAMIAKLADAQMNNKILAACLFGLAMAVLMRR